MPKHIGANKLKKRAERRSGANLKRITRRGMSVVKVVLVGAAICAGAAAVAQRAWTWLNTSPRFVVRRIDVRGTVRINSSEILRLSRIKEGMRMLEVEPRKVERAIRGNCWIGKARVARAWPGTVKISVEERTPIALASVGRVYYLDKDGVLLPMFAATYSDLPVISGIVLDSADRAGGQVPTAVMGRIRSLFEGAGRVSQSLMRRVAQIDVSNQSMVRLKMENSSTLVEIDDGKGIDQWTRFQRVLDILNTSPDGMPQRINLCYSNLAFAQW